MQIDPDSLLTQRIQWEKDNPRDPNLRKAEKGIVQGLNREGLGQQYQVTRQDGFEIAVDNLIITVVVSPP